MMSQPHIFVLGNQKGGTGKSTVCIHLIVGLLRAGQKVGSIDTDARQGTLSRYVENRRAYALGADVHLPLPKHYAIFSHEGEFVDDWEEKERSEFLRVLEELKDCDSIVIDTPGSNSYLSRLAHSFADTLITPINDSFIDLDLLVRMNASGSIVRPSIYSAMVWEQRKQKMLRHKKNIEWIVLRNRLSSVYSKNREEIEKIMQSLSKRIGFQHCQGFGERVIFRELFLQGLTLLDLQESDVPMTLSHVAAKQELTRLFQTIFPSTRASLSVREVSL